MRSFIRHSATMPVQVESNQEGSQNKNLRNVGAGGLCFYSNHYLPLGISVKIDIPNLDNTFSENCTVAWCKKTDNDQYAVGVTFDNYQTALRMRMIEQICYIEDYRNDVLNNQKRNISAEEASKEWLEKYADRIFKI